MTLLEIYDQHVGFATGKYEHYLAIYDRYFLSFKNRPITIVEVGVGGGGSLQAWDKYFNGQAKVYGIDAAEKSYLNFDPKGQIKVIQGNQNDRDFWKRILPEIGKIDIFIDDGGHVSSEQIVTFEEVFPYLNNEGIYICEDVQTSYIPSEPFYAGPKKTGTFIEYCKALIDVMNAWATEGQDDFQKTELTRVIHAVNFFTFLIIIEKKNMDKILYSPIMRGGQHVR